MKRPYFKVFGGDIRSGLGFVNSGGVCVQGGDGSIRASGALLTGNGWRGASAQYAVVANGVIDGFASATMRSSPPKSPTGLTFANQSLTGAPYGGKFGNGSCLPNYWNDLRESPDTTPVGTTNITQIFAAAGPKQVLVNGTTNSSIGSGNGCGLISNKTYKSSSSWCYSLSSINPRVEDAGQPGYTNIPSAPIVLNHSLTMFVQGDLDILSNVLLPSTGWASPADIPYLTVVVCGNIYIDRLVTELNGWFIAMPAAYCPSAATSGDPGGNIFTCTNKFDSIPDALQGTVCDSTLTVRGSFTSQSIKFQRTHGAVGTAPTVENSSSGNIAEKFIYDPTFWIGTPAQKVLNLTTGTTKLDNFTGLPPIL